MSTKEYLAEFRKVILNNPDEPIGVCLFLAIPTDPRFKYFHSGADFVGSVIDPFGKCEADNLAPFFQWLIDHEDLLVYEYEDKE